MSLRSTWAGKRHSPIGETKRVAVQHEAGHARAFEKTLSLHRCDFWPCTVAQLSQAGWPDYVVLGEGWHAFVELKAHDEATAYTGKLRKGQERYRDAIIRAGGEWLVFTLPDDWPVVDDWLISKTGIEARGVWRR